MKRSKRIVDAENRLAELNDIQRQRTLTENEKKELIKYENILNESMYHDMKEK